MRDDGEGRVPLRFEDRAGSWRSQAIAGGIALALVLWMASGYLLPSGDDADVAEAPARRPVAVAVADSRAEPVTRYFTAEGQALPDRETVIRAETSGRISEVAARKGMVLEEGAVIARFELDEREAQLAQARAALDQARTEYDNAEQLLTRGVATATRVSEARAALAAAEASVVEAEAALADAVVRAPFAGLLDDLAIDPGEYVATGSEIGRIIDTDPLTVEVQVPQQRVADLEAGQTAEVRFITGETAEGRVAYVSGSADPATRTFRAEIVVPNDSRTIPAGISARVRVPTGTTTAHFISPAILSLDADGTLGVKTVGSGDTVDFVPVQIVRAQTDGIWVEGLDATARIITIGQGFVAAGETVDPRPAGGDAGARPLSDFVRPAGASRVEAGE